MRLVLTALIGGTMGLLALASCGTERAPFAPAAESEGGAPMLVGDDAADVRACEGLACQQQDCASGVDTIVSGTVFAPNGELPLFNAIVYVPNAAVGDVPQG